MESPILLGLRIPESLLWLNSDFTTHIRHWDRIKRGSKAPAHVAMLGADRREYAPENSYIRLKKCAPKKYKT